MLLNSIFSLVLLVFMAGTDLSEVDVTWRQGELNGINDQAACLTMSKTGELGDDSCGKALPYFCYKSVSQGKRLSCDQNEDNPNSEYKYVIGTGSCYMFHTDRTTWWLAYKRCLAEGGYLAVINNEFESQVLKGLLAHNDANDAYIGIRIEDGEWFTIHYETVDEAGFAVFDRVARPLNDSTDPQYLHCGTVTKAGLLHDHDCMGKAYYICEKLPVQLKGKLQCDRFTLNRSHALLCEFNGRVMICITTKSTN